MSRYRDQVSAALQAVQVLGPTRYAWLGRRSRPVSASLQAEMDDLDRRTYLVACLREELYSSFYCRGRPVPARWGLPEPVSPDPLLTEELSASNHALGAWESGWTVERLEHDQAIVATSRLRVRASTLDCRPRTGPLRPGARVRLRVPKELPALSPGFFTVVGGALDDRSAAGVVRVYWNVGRASAPTLVRALTTKLTSQRATFRLKVANHPSRLDRCDAAVLYMPAPSFRSWRLTLRRVAAELAPELGRLVPAMTLELASGVGVAEDGDAGDSFGIRRCAALADGVVAAHERGLVDLGARLELVAARLARDGIDIDHPYLEPSLVGRHVL